MTRDDALALLVALRHDGRLSALEEGFSSRTYIHRPEGLVATRGAVAAALAGAHARAEGTGVHAERAISARHPHLPGTLHGLAWDDSRGHPHLALWHALDGRVVEGWEADAVPRDPSALREAMAETDPGLLDDSPGEVANVPGQVAPGPAAPDDPAPWLHDLLSRGDPARAADAFAARAVLRWGEATLRGRDAIRAAFARVVAGTRRRVWSPALPVRDAGATLSAGHALVETLAGRRLPLPLLAWADSGTDGLASATVLWGEPAARARAGTTEPVLGPASAPPGAG